MEAEAEAEAEVKKYFEMEAEAEAVQKFGASHSLIIYTISGNRIVSGPKSFVSYQILLQIDPINPLGLVSG